MGRIEQHLGMGELFKIDDEPVVLSDNTQLIIQPLGIEHLPKFMRVAKKLAGKSEEQLMQSMDDDVVKDISGLLTETLTKSMPNEKPETREHFAMKNMQQLMEVIVKLNMPNTTHDKTKKDKILERIKQHDGQAKPDTE